MFVFGIIATLVLLLIFLMVKNQSLKSQLQLIQGKVRGAGRRIDENNANAIALAMATQMSLTSRINSMHSNTEVEHRQLLCIKTLIHVLPDLVKRTLEQDDTVEIALEHLLQESTLDIDEVKSFLFAQGNDIKILWSKNSPGDYAKLLVLLVDQLDHQ